MKSRWEKGTTWRCSEKQRSSLFLWLTSTLIIMSSTEKQLKSSIFFPFCPPTSALLPFNYSAVLGPVLDLQPPWGHRRIIHHLWSLHQPLAGGCCRITTNTLFIHGLRCLPVTWWMAQTPNQLCQWKSAERPSLYPAVYGALSFLLTPPSPPSYVKILLCLMFQAWKRCVGNKESKLAVERLTLFEPKTLDTEWIKAFWIAFLGASSGQQAGGRRSVLEKGRMEALTALLNRTLSLTMTWSDSTMLFFPPTLAVLLIL